MAEFTRFFIMTPADPDDDSITEKLEQFRKDIEDYDTIEVETVILIADYEVTVIKAWKGMDEPIGLVPVTDRLDRLEKDVARAGAFTDILGGDPVVPDGPFVEGMTTDELLETAKYGLRDR